MMNIETKLVSGFMPAILGMRNPLNSWHKSDSLSYNGEFALGSEDKHLAKTLISAGAEHCKFLRQIQVWADMTMPRYWWSEFDTYHFNSKNSCSTMHTIMKRPLKMEDFYMGNASSYVLITLHDLLHKLNFLRDNYMLTKDYAYVMDMKRLLPESFLQMRTVNTNYAELMNIYHQRKNHKQKAEWQDTFCKWCETLPYFKELCIDVKKEVL